MKLLQKTVLIAATAAVAISAAEANKKNFRSGVYAGAELGWLYDEHKYTDTRSGAAFVSPQVTSITQKSHKNKSSFLPGIFAGYRHFMNCYYVGFELSAFINSSKSSSRAFSDTLTNGVSKYKFKGKYNIIPAVTFGREFNDRLGVYAKAGYDFGAYKYHVTETAAGDVTNSKHSHKHISRFLLGVGIETAINCLWSARLEYNYSFPQSKKKIKMLASNSTNGINDYIGKVKVSSSALKVGMFAKF